MRQKWLQKPPLGTPINWSHPSAKGLVLDLVFQEGGGDLANDLSGNANHGTFKNMAFPSTIASGWNPGKFGAAPIFDGSNDYVDCGNGSSLNITDAITMEAWVKRGTIAGYMRMIAKGTRSTGYTFRMQNDGKIEFAALIGGVAQQLGISDDGIAEGVWSHVVTNYDGNTVKYYINGEPSGEKTPSPTGAIGVNVSALMISSENGANYFFPGQIDQVRIYNRALSEREILDSYISPFRMFERNNLWDYVTAPPVGAVMNQFQKVNMGADLYDGALVT